MIIRVIDTETTGIPDVDEVEKHALVEVGWTDVARGADGAWRVGYPHSMLVNPGRLIPPDASAIHHIRDEDVRDAPPPSVAIARLLEVGDAYAAHNMEFDQQFVDLGAKPRLCTFKCALRVFKDAPDHKNQVLRYFLGFDDEDDFEPAMAMPPHRAGPDSYVSAHLLAHLLEATDFDDLIKWSSGPALLIRCWMNKHKGKLWSQVAADDPSYLDWIVERSDVTDRNIRATAKYWLKKTADARKEAAAKPTTDGEVKL